MPSSGRLSFAATYGGPFNQCAPASRFVKDTIEGSHLEPTVLCALRYSVATLMLLPLMLGPGVKKINGNLSFELGFLLFCAYQFQARELVTESASQGSIMLAVYILLVPVVEVLFGRAFTTKKVISLGVAICGIALLQAGALKLLARLFRTTQHCLRPHDWLHQKHGGAIARIGS